MELLCFKVDESLIKRNMIEMEETIKLLLYDKDNNIFDLLDFDNDQIYLEPTLFFHFLAENRGEEVFPLNQIFWGYLPNDKKPKLVTVQADEFGIIYLPNYGYFKYLPHEKIDLHWDDINEREFFKANGSVVDLKKIGNSTLPNSDIQICKHVPEILTKYFSAKFDESIEKTISRYAGFYSQAFNIMQQIVPGYIELLKLTCREISFFNSPNQFSLASFSYFGTAFINVENQPHDEVFFIDDIAHQCGHVLYTTLTLHWAEYLRAPKMTLLKEFTGVEKEERDIYGTFHGLFTYTTILHCLDKCLDSNLLNEKQRHEATGRLAFYMDKFRKDLGHMNDRRILTNKGFDYFDMFKKGYDTMYDKYNALLRELDFSNQSYIFRYDLFANANSVAMNTN